MNFVLGSDVFQKIQGFCKFAENGKRRILDFQRLIIK